MLNFYFMGFWVCVVVGIPLFFLWSLFYYGMFLNVVLDLFGHEWFVHIYRTFSLVFCAVFLGGVTFHFMLLYQFWKLIPKDIARTTPGKAVGLMFVPLFNFYWMFVTFKGLCEDMNKTLRQRGIQYQVNEGLGFVFCILIIVYLISTIKPIISFLLLLVMFFVLILYLKSVKNGAFALLEQTDDEPQV